MFLYLFPLVLGCFLWEICIFVSESLCKITRAVFTGCELAECVAFEAVTEFRQVFKRAFSMSNYLKFSKLACTKRKVHKL